MLVKAKKGLLQYKPHLEMITKDSNEVKSSEWTELQAMFFTTTLCEKNSSPGKEHTQAQGQ